GGALRDVLHAARSRYPARQRQVRRGLEAPVRRLVVDRRRHLQLECSRTGLNPHEKRFELENRPGGSGPLLGGDLPLERAGRNGAAAEVEREVLRGTAQRRARPEAPVDVGRLKSAAADLGAEMSMSATSC